MRAGGDLFVYVVRLSEVSDFEAATPFLFEVGDVSMKKQLEMTLAALGFVKLFMYRFLAVAALGAFV